MAEMSVEMRCVLPYLEPVWREMVGRVGPEVHRVLGRDGLGGGGGVVPALARYTVRSAVGRRCNIIFNQNISEPLSTAANVLQNSEGN